MSLAHRDAADPDNAIAPLVGRAEQWPPGSAVAMHSHRRHQLMYSTRGVMHVTTSAGTWILPPSRAIWIAGGITHALRTKRALDLIVLYIEAQAQGAPSWDRCVVIDVSPLVRELITACAACSWDDGSLAPQSRLGRVLLDQLSSLSQAPLNLPEPRDCRAARVAGLVRDDPEGRAPLAQLAPAAGASPRTIERLFIRETGMSFGAWRLRYRMMLALELLADGEAVGNVAMSVGYETASSFIAAFRAMFGTSPARFFA